MYTRFIYDRFSLFLIVPSYFFFSSRMLSVRENSESMSGLYAFDTRFPLLKIYKFLKYSSIRLVLPSSSSNKLWSYLEAFVLNCHETHFLLKHPRVWNWFKQNLMLFWLLVKPWKQHQRIKPKKKLIFSKMHIWSNRLKLDCQK